MASRPPPPPPWSPARLLKPLRWATDEFGLRSVWTTGRDAWLIIGSRCLRMCAYGAQSLTMALFFASLQFSDFRIGLFMTLTLLGDVALSLGVSLVADRVGRRRVLFGGALFMVLSGAVFLYFENFWILLAAAVIGVVSATGGDFGPFRSVEESTLSHLTTPKTRSDVLSWYVTTSSLGSAAGTELSGRIVDYLRSLDGWEDKHAYHALFGLYLLNGSLCMLFAYLMSDKCEEEDKPAQETGGEASEGLLREGQHDDEDEDDTKAPPSSPTSNEASKPTPAKRAWIASISSQTRTIMYKLGFLLAVDSMADGMSSYSLTNYYLDRKFHLSKSTLGDIASIGFVLMSCSTVFAAPLAKRLGLVNTMVFTHLPSSAAVLLFPAPQGIVLTVALLFVRLALNNMDQAPRAAFIAAVVKPEERTAVMGIIGMARTLSAAVGPSITGSLAGNDKFWIAFVMAGAARIAYDLGLFAMFVNVKLHTHEPDAVQPDDPRRSNDEEMTELRPMEEARRE